MLRTVRAVMALSMVALIGSAVWLGARGGPSAEAQGDFALGIAATLRANKVEIPRGGELALLGGLMNLGARTIEVGFSCAPPVDFEVRSQDGIVMWRHSSNCASDDRAIRLEPGARREWDAVWPGTGPGGTPVASGYYTVWAVIHTEGRSTGAGPLWVHVGEGGSDLPTEVRPTEGPAPTDRPRPTEGPAPTDAPRPTEGVPADGPPFLIGGGDGAQRRPDVAGNWEQEDCQNLVVWWNEATGAVQGRFVETGWRGDAFNISGERTANGAPAVAYHSGRRTWLVVWPGSSEGTTQLFSRFVRCDGVEGAVRQLTEGEGNKDQPAVASHGEGYAIAWRQRAGDSSQVHGAAYMGDGLSQHLVLEDGGASEPALACEPLEPCLAVWTQATDATGNNVMARWWWPREEAAGSVYLTVAGGEANQRDAAVAWRGGEVGRYLVTWTEGGEDLSVVRARGVAPEGSSRSPDAYRLITEPTTVSDAEPASMSDVAALGDGYVVVWSEAGDGPAEIRGRTVRIVDNAHRHGALVDVSRPVIDFPPTDTFPAVAPAGRDVALVVWESRTQSPNDEGEIYGRHRRFTFESDVPLVQLSGRVTRVGAGLMQNGQHVEVAVERVLAGSFSCQTAHVYFDAGAWDVPAVGDRVQITAQSASSGEPCALDVGAPGTGIVALTAEPAFAPYAFRP